MDEVQNKIGDEAKSSKNIQTLLATFRQIGQPLMSAIAEAPDKDPSKSKEFDPEQFNKLVESIVTLSREISAKIGSGEDSLDAAARWALAGSASQVVASNFRATGKALSEDDAKHIAEMVLNLQIKFKNQIPSGGETIPNTIATFRAKMMEAMVPVIGAVAQYSFARAEHALLAEVAERLIKISDQITRALAPSGATPEQWRLLCWSILRASGQIYTECHFAEADRLLYMDAEARAEYFAKSGDTVPMTQVWQAFNQRMAMLATLSTYLEVPSSAQFENQVWS